MVKVETTDVSGVESTGNWQLLFVDFDDLVVVEYVVPAAAVDACGILACESVVELET